MAELVAEETALIEAAAHGDHEAFRKLVDPISRELHLFSYRMLGSFHDAEDVLQDSQLKAWRRLDTYDRRASFRAWMYKIVTNTSLDALRTRRRRVLPQDVSTLGDPTQGLGEQRLDIPWLEPYPDSLLEGANPEEAVELRESIRLAFVRALQLLPPRQRAVLILRDVLDWPAADVAAMLEASVPAVNSALQRARATLAHSDPSKVDVYEGGRLDAKKAEMASRYVSAWEAGDIEAVVSMLTEDAVHSMPPWASWFAGRDALRVLYRSYEVWGGQPGPDVFRILPTSLNGDLGFAEYLREGRDGPYKALAFTLVTLTRDGTSIAEKVSFVSPNLFAKFGFPQSVS
ncbi:MAG: RNA polymerase subunit sigma-70 [Armatimonadota bacterium]